MGFMAMFKKEDPKDLVREWQSKMRTEMRGVDRQIRGTNLCRERERVFWKWTGELDHETRHVCV